MALTDVRGRAPGFGAIRYGQIFFRIAARRWPARAISVRTWVAAY